MPSSQINLCEFPCTVINDGIDLDFFCMVSVFSLCTSVCIFCLNKAHKVSLCTFVCMLWGGNQHLKQKLASVCIRNELLRLDTHFLLFTAFIKHDHAVMNSVLMCATPLFFPCDGLSFGLGLPGTVCSILTAWEVKPAWSLASARGSVSLPHLLHFSPPKIHGRGNVCVPCWKI